MMKPTITHPHFKTIVLLIALCGCCFFASAQLTTATSGSAVSKAVPAQTAASIVENFFKKYKAEGSGPAIDYLFATNKYFSNPAGIARLKGKLDTLRQSVGDYIGRELIAEKSASGSLILYSYLVKHEIQPIRFTFIFYKPHNDWVFYRFLFDDQMDQELEDAAKIGSKHVQ